MMMALCDRTNCVVQKLLSSKLKENSTIVSKLEIIATRITEIRDLDIDPKDISLVEHHLPKLEVLTTISDDVFSQTIISEIDQKLGRLRVDDRLVSLADIVSRLNVVFISILDPSIAKIAATMTEALNRLKLHMTVSKQRCETKQHFINELLNAPYNDVLDFLQYHSKTDLNSALRSISDDFRTYLIEQAKAYGFTFDELVSYINSKHNQDQDEAYGIELEDYVKKTLPLERSLQHFVSTIPEVNGLFMTSEEVNKYKFLFENYCQQVAHLIQDADLSNVQTGRVTSTVPVSGDLSKMDVAKVKEGTSSVVTVPFQTSVFREELTSELSQYHTGMISKSGEVKISEPEVCDWYDTRSQAIESMQDNESWFAVASATAPSLSTANIAKHNEYSFSSNPALALVDWQSAIPNRPGSTSTGTNTSVLSGKDRSNAWSEPYWLRSHGQSSRSSASSSSLISKETTQQKAKRNRRARYSRRR